MWDKLISKYENIVLVLSGHDPSNTIVTTQTKGVHGNTVTQMLIDPQGLDDEVKGGTGMVAMLYFSEDGSEIQVEYISTVKNAYFLEENQFTVKIDTVKKSDETTPDTETEAPVEESTEAPTEEVTEASTEEVTETPTEESTDEATEALTQPEAPTETPTDAPDNGCGAVVSLGAVSALAVMAAWAFKKKKDRI